MLVLSSSVGPSAAWVLPAEPAAVGQLRRHAVQFASGKGVSDDVFQAIALAASETVTNAVVHAYDDGNRGQVRVSCPELSLMSQTLTLTSRRLTRVRWDGPDAMMAECPPGWIIGVVEEVVERLTALRAAGVSRVICQHLAADDLDFIALLGGELAPLVA